MTSNCIICDKEFTHVRNEAVTCSPVCNAKKQFNKKKLDRLSPKLTIMKKDLKD